MPMEKRYLQDMVVADALDSGKMAFVTGPRQVGKTTLAKAMLRDSGNYFSWDSLAFRRAWVKDPLEALGALGRGPIVLDELHKYRSWKNSLKGLYDTHHEDLQIIVTGSGRLDVFRKGGDSLTGRYLPYRLFPFSVSESSAPPNPDELSPQSVVYPLEDQLHCGSFPEPLLGGSRKRALRWSRLREEQLVREDIRDFRNVNDLGRLHLFVNLLPGRIGSPLSLNSIQRDIETSYATLRAWYQVLRSLYVFFEVPPFTGKVKRSLTKEKKIYLYDTLPIEAPGALVENILALHLYKSCCFWTDAAAGHFELFYIRNKQKEEVDFCICRDKKVWMLVECKSLDTSVSSALVKFAKLLKPKHVYQTTTQKDYDKKDAKTGIRVMPLEKFLRMWV